MVQRSEQVFVIAAQISLVNSSQAFVKIVDGNRFKLDVTLYEIAVQALKESPLTKEESWSQGNVWRPIEPEHDGNDVTVAFRKTKSL